MFGRFKKLFGKGKKPAKRPPKILRYEELEPRVLFSADILPGLDSITVDEQVLVEDATGSEQFVREVASAMVEQTAAEARNELIIINPNIPDYEQLVADLQGGDNKRVIEVVVLEADSEGIEQVSDILAERSDLSAVHFITHGADGQINLGNSWLNLNSLQQNSETIAGWGRALNEAGDFLFYGCNIAADSSGQNLVNEIARLTGADVAASNDLTGKAQFGADWVLEFEKGSIETGAAINSETQLNWNGVLATFTVDTTLDTVDANPGDDIAADASSNTSLRAAIMEANARGGVNEIILNAGTYTLSEGSPGENAAFGGDLDVTGELTITGAGAGVTIIDGGGLDRVFDIRSTGNLTMSNVTIQGGDTIATGGGLQVNSGGRLTLNNVIIKDNQANQGGGLYNAGTVWLNDVEFIDNGRLTTATGGGLHNDGDATLNRVTIIGSRADTGAGIYNSNSATNLSLTNTTVSANTAVATGGGLYTRSPVAVVNSTFTSNLADTGGGIRTNGGGGDVDLLNTIIAGNTASSSAPDVSGNFSSSGNNLIGDGTGTSDLVNGASNDQVGSDSNPIMPLLDSLRYNGGFTRTHALLTSSPAIDSGTSTGAPTLDQRGYTRGASPDAGAYEFGAAFSGSPGGVDAGDLKLWLKADAGVATDAGGVSQWDNQVANTTLPDLQQSMSSERPDVNPSALNFNPVITFDGSDDALWDTSVLGTDLFAQDAASIFVVARVNNSGVVLQWEEDTNNRVNIEGTSPRFDFGDDVPPDSLDGSGMSAGYHLVNVQAVPGGPVDLQIFVDGTLDVQNGASSANPLNPAVSGPFVLGEWAGGGINVSMDLAEVVIYRADLNATDQQKVESYLAIKYGITLDQALPANYVASDGMVIWDATLNAGYNNDVAGIGQDDASGLAQPQSRSINSDAIVTVSNASNQATGEFLLWGNDDGASTETSVGNPAGVLQRLQRIWCVDETGDVGSTTITFDVSGLPVSGTNASDFKLIIDTDTDFTSGATLVAADSYAGNVVTFTGVDLNNGQVFALGTDINDTPTVALFNMVASISENSDTMLRTKMADITVTDDGTGTNVLSLAGADAGMFEIQADVLYLKAGAVLDHATNPFLDVTVQVNDTTLAPDPNDSTSLSIGVTDTSGPAQGSLWFTTKGSSDSGGETWTGNELVMFGDSGDTFDIDGGTTSGTIMKLPGLSSPGDIRGIHFVQTDITLGTTGTQFSLSSGDLIMALDETATFHSGEPGEFTADRKDIVVFQPDTAGDYSNGTWSMLLEEGVQNSGATYNVHAISLIEVETIVGGQVLLPGTFLVSHSGPSLHNNIYSFTVIGTGLGIDTQTTDTQSFLLGGALGNTGEQIQGLHLLQQDTEFGTTTLATGTLLVQVKNADPYAGQAHDEYDIVALEVGATEATGGTAATGSLFFQGTDIGLDAANEEINGFTIKPSILLTPNEPPTVALSNTITTISEDADTTNRTQVADITITDDALGTNDLSLSGADAGLFEIDTGVLYLKAGAALDHETNAALDVTVEVNDATIAPNPNATAGLSITVADANEPPTVALSNTTTTISEAADTTNRTKVADITVTDDALGTNDLILTGSDASMFEIDTGVVYLKAGAALDHETNAALDVTVEVNDATIAPNPNATAGLSITVADANEPPTVALSNTTTTISEAADTTNRTKVADITVTDDALGTNDLILTGSDASMFEIDTGVVYLKAGAALDHETNAALDVTVEVNDATIAPNPNATAGLSITVADANEPPTVALSNTTTTISEAADTTNRTKVADITVTDDALGTNDLILTGSDASMFEIDTGVVYLKAGAALDHETNAALDVTVEVNDATIAPNPNATAGLSITVADANEPPTVALSNTTTTISEAADTTNRTKVADITVTDDALGTNDLILTGSDASMFEIDTGVVYLKAGAALDHETNAALDVTVEVNDATIAPNPNATAGLSITVADANEPPTVALSNTTTTISEAADTTNRTKVADITVTDDALGTNDLILTGSDVSMFEIDTGVVYLKAGAALDHETNAALDVTVEVNDATIAPNPNATAGLSITVADANEPPTVALSNTTTTISEAADTTNRTKVADITVTDDALGTNDLILTGSDASMFEIDTGVVYLKAGAALDHETNAALDVTVEVNDATIAPNPNATAGLSITVADANEPPTVALSNTTTTISEAADTTNRTKVADITVTDDALGTNDLILTGSDASMFEIDTGVVYLKAGAALDHETNAALDVTVEVNDATIAPNPNATAGLSITVADANEPPELGKNNLTITEGATVVFDNSMLSATDEDNPDPGLTFDISAVNGGQFERVSTGLALTAFTQADIEAGEIRFVHDGSQTAPSYSVTVSDGSASTGPTPAAISFTNTNDSGSVTIDNTTPSQGDSLTAKVVDFDGASGTITYQWYRNGAAIGGAAAADYTTTQADVGKVITVTAKYTDDQGTAENLTSAGTAAVINVNDTPVLDNNRLSISEGATVTLDSSMLSATDVDHPNQSLNFNVSEVTAGYFAFSSDPATPITSFNQSDITAGNVVFVHDSSQTQPGYSISVTDGADSTAPITANITFTNLIESLLPSIDFLTFSDNVADSTDSNMPSTTDDVKHGPSEIAHESAGRTGQMSNSNDAVISLTGLNQGETANGTVVFIQDGNKVSAADSKDFRRFEFGRFNDDKPGSDRTYFSYQRLKLLLDAQNFGELKAALGNSNISILSSSDYDLVRNSLDAIKAEIGNEIMLGKTVLGSAIAATIGLSAGYVVWLLKGGSLLASVLSSIPAWQLADPLAILVGKKGDDDEEEDDESLETIIDDGKNRDEGRENKDSGLKNLKKESVNQ